MGAFGVPEVTARAFVAANAVWHREVAGQGSRAGTGGCCSHAIQDGWSAEVAESFGFPPGRSPDLQQ